MIPAPLLEPSGPLSAPGDTIGLLYSNRPAPAVKSPVVQLPAGTVNVTEVDGSQGSGPVNVTHVTVQPIESQILRKG